MIGSKKTYCATDSDPFVDPFSGETIDSRVSRDRAKGNHVGHMVYFLKISSYRGNDDEAWRNVRLMRVVKRFVDKEPALARWIFQVHDHKGTLYVAFRGKGRKVEQEKAYRLLREEWCKEDESECSMSWSFLGYNPHPQIDYPYVV